MIAHIKGTIEEKLSDRVIVETGGLGYEVFLSAADVGDVSQGQSVGYFVYEQLRDDAHNLYGFTSRQSRDLFVHLIGTNGVGPKVAMAILSASTIEQLKRAIASGDVELFRGVAGVGKKTAERIMIELRGKLGSAETTGTITSDSAYQALVGLGYSSAQAAEAMAKLPAGLPDDQARLKAALKELSN